MAVPEGLQTESLPVICTRAAIKGSTINHLRGAWCQFLRCAYADIDVTDSIISAFHAGCNKGGHWLSMPEEGVRIELRDCGLNQ